MGWDIFRKERVLTIKMRNLTRGNKPGLLALLAVLGAVALAPPAEAVSMNGDLIQGQVMTYTVQKKESLYDIARKFDMGAIEIQAANPGVNPWKPKAGTKVIVTTKHVVPSITHDGILINLSASRLFYFPGGGEVMTFPVASGKEGWETPVAATTVIEKKKNPTWTPPARIRAENPDLPEFIPPGPDNPLGQYAMALGLSGIMIHGTTSPTSIGKHASHGCIRMYPEDIKTLFNAVPRGTPVLITKTPYVIGWQGDTLYLQVTPKVHTVSKKTQKPPPADKMLHQAVSHEAGDGTTVYWNVVDDVMARGDGIPTVIGTRQSWGPRLPEPVVGSLPQSQRASLTIITDEDSFHRPVAD